MIYLTEKEFISKKRLEHLEHAKNVWNIDIEKIKQLEKKYGYIQYLPIDADIENVPNELIDFFFTNSKFARSNHKNYDNLWKGLFKENKLDLNTNESIKNKNESLFDLEEMFRDFFNQLLDALPYKKLESYSFISNQRDVNSHKDYCYMIGLPISFRCVIYNNGSSFTNSFYDYIPTGEGKNFKNLEEATTEHWNDGYTGKMVSHYTNISRFYAYNNLTVKHDAKKYDNQEKILFIPKVYNPIDWDKFDDMISKSIAKNSNSAMITDNPLETYVNL